MSKEKNKLKPIDTPVYRYWSALYMSFYSRRLYVDVGKRWRGFAFLYLLLTIALFSIPFALRMGFSLNQSFKEQITDPLSKIPVFYIQNGEVSFDKPMPYLIKNDQNQVVVLIDTTGKVNDFPAEYPYLTILINKNKISLKVPSLKLFNMKDSKPSKGTPLVQTFDKGTNLVFDGKKDCRTKLNKKFEIFFSNDDLSSGSGNILFNFYCIFPRFSIFGTSFFQYILFF